MSLEVIAMQLTRTILVTTIAALSAHLGGIAASYSDAALTVRPSEYVGITYAPPATGDAAYLFFSNEPIALELRVTNRGSIPITLANVGASPAANFRIVRGQTDAFAIQSDVFRQGAGAPTPVTWVSPIQIEAQESLIIGAVHVGSPLPPGEYIVEWDTTIRDQNGLRVAPQSTRVQFEVRASAEDTAPEEARRNAARAFLRGDDRLAEQWADELLRLHPRSYAAHLIRAEVSLKTGNRQRMLQSYATALQILNANADDQFVRWTNPRTARDIADGVKARIRSQGGQP